MTQTIYKTRQRETIINLLRNNPDITMSAEEIYLDLSKNNTDISLSTIYRNLSYLSRQGVIKKYLNQNGTFEFGIVKKSCRTHFHLNCIKCGAIVHLHCNQIDQLRTHILIHHNFLISTPEAAISGICKKCQKEAICA